MSWILHNKSLDEFIKGVIFNHCQCVHSDTLEQCSYPSWSGLPVCKHHMGIHESYVVPYHIEQRFLRNFK